MTDKARLFEMVRNNDETGVSGTGVVLDGVVFPNGMVSVCWRSQTPSVTFYRSYVEFKHVHIDAHPTNNTEIHWKKTVDGEVEKQVNAPK